MYTIPFEFVPSYGAPTAISSKPSLFVSPNDATERPKRPLLVLPLTYPFSDLIRN